MQVLRVLSVYLFSITKISAIHIKIIPYTSHAPPFDFTSYLDTCQLEDIERVGEGCPQSNVVASGWYSSTCPQISQTMLFVLPAPMNASRSVKIRTPANEIICGDVIVNRSLERVNLE
jgi:hypothetical protein